MLIGLWVSQTACNKIELEEGVPSCVKKMIKKTKKGKSDNLATEVWKWTVDNQIYYYFSGGCSDCLNYLYDNNCNLICAPSGGFSWGGDGNCPSSIYNNQIERIKIWEDSN